MSEFWQGALTVIGIEVFITALLVLSGFKCADIESEELKKAEKEIENLPEWDGK